MSLLLILAVVAAQPSEVPTAGTEMLRIDAPDEFEMGHKAVNQTQAIYEFVDPPETVENWSRMITMQLISNGAISPGAEAFYSQWREGLRAACAAMTDSVERGTVDGRPAIKSVTACPKSPNTGKPENLSAVLIQGHAILAIAQVAFRRPFTPDDIALVQRITGSLKLCDRRTLEACLRRKATGFVPAK